VPDPIDRLNRIAEGDGVDPAPLSGGEHARIHLQMQMPVRIAGARGVMPHRHRLQPLDRDRDLRPARTHPGGRVSSEPADDLLRCSVLCGFVGGREVGVQLRRERPRLRPVYRHLDEAHRAPVGAQPASRLTKNWAGHEVLDLPANKWSIAKNDQWVQSVVDRKMPVYVGSPTTWPNLWDAAAGRTTVFGRELQQFTKAGYTWDGWTMIPPGG
jgi:hypothetical protein